MSIGLYSEELNLLVSGISQRTARSLEKRGLLERNAENSYLLLEQPDEDTMHYPRSWGRLLPASNIPS